MRIHFVDRKHDRDTVLFAKHFWHHPFGLFCALIPDSKRLDVGLTLRVVFADDNYLVRVGVWSFTRPRRVFIITLSP